MKLDRRSFLQWAAASGVVVGSSPMWTRKADASADPFGGPYWLFVHAAGGWDPTLLCDPKGRANEDAEDPVNMYFEDEIEEVGPFRVPPVEGHLAFFERFRDRLLVLNGVDTQTNSHEVGTRHTWSGTMDVGHPAVGAVIAATRDGKPSLAWLTNGGYDLSGGLVAPTRLSDTSTILEIAYPDRLDEEDPESLIFTQATLDRLASARAERLARLTDGASLPRVRRSLTRMAAARTGENELAALASVLPQSLDNSNNELRRQAQVAISCFRAGVSVAATMTTGGFDTHSEHDNSHTPSLRRVIEGVTYAMDEAERQGIADKLVIVVGSDFARTPWYNDGNGKDHWPVTSMMMMGPGIRGGRVIGATDARQVARKVDPVSLQLSETGVRITPGHVHRALRQLAGIGDGEVAQRFPLDGELLPLFG